MTKNLLVALLTLSSGAALAQTEAAPTESAPAQPEVPSAEEQLTTTEGKLAALEEQVAEVKTDVSALKKLKFSGYVQARYVAQQSLDEMGTGGFNRFFVRRARLKGTYEGDLMRYVLQIDASATGVELRDAEATLFIPGTQKNLALSIGQMKWPFGYEGPVSSSEREFPERSRVVRAFLPSERDRGARLTGKMGTLRLSAGVFDGNGINNTGFIGTDNDKEKDLVGRLGFDAKWISGGLSGWYGNTLGKRTGATPDEFRKAYSRSRLGADMQVYLDLLPLGGTALKGEYITGTTYQRSNVEQLGVPASGWWALLSQNVGLSNVLAVRYDYFDPENGRQATESNGKLGSVNAVGTLGVTAIHYFGSTLKLSATYEIPMTATVEGGTAEDPRDNLFTLQLQAGF